jgi:hypothetical protein
MNLADSRLSLMGSIAAAMPCPPYVRFPSDSDGREDIPDWQFLATNKSRVDRRRSPMMQGQ